MILVSLGNLGDLLIQAAFLRRFDRADCSVAVPESYAHIASELFAQAAVISMPDQWSDGRVLAEAQINRATAVARILKELRAQHPGATVKSIALTDDVILDRSLNIYEAYWRVLGRDPEIAANLSPTIFPSPKDIWIPFTHLPRWTTKTRSKVVCFCPWGGIRVKNIPAPDLLRLRESALSFGYGVRLLSSPRDDATNYPFFTPNEFVRLSTDRLISDAVDHLSAAALIIAVDTAWYHLAALIDAPVLGISGPRSLGHFSFPASLRVAGVAEQRLCVDCFSTDRCVVTSSPICEAKPHANQMHAAMEATLKGLPRPPLTGWK